MTPENQNSLLLGNYSVERFPRERTLTLTIELLFLCNGEVNNRGILRKQRFMLGPPWGYMTRISGQLREFLRESLETATGDDWEEMEREELGCEKKTSYVLQLQWDWYNYYVEIRCQDTTSEDWGH
jgi:hypothetical protein